MWHPALAWLEAVYIPDRRFDQLIAINEWLREGGAAEPVVAEAERGYQLFRDEKAFASLKTSRLWGPNGLNHRLLRCVPKELVWLPVGRGHRALVSENRATFESIARALREIDGHAYAAAVWSEGGFATSAAIGRLIALPAPVAATDYVGDLDTRGLEIGAAWCANMERLGVAARAHPILWEMMLEREPITNPRPPDPREILRLVAWLPEPLRDRAAAILGAGMRVPQEAVGYIALRSDRRWALAT